MGEEMVKIQNRFLQSNVLIWLTGVLQLDIQISICCILQSVATVAPISLKIFSHSVRVGVLVRLVQNFGKNGKLLNLTIHVVKLLSWMDPKQDYIYGADKQMEETGLWQKKIIATTAAKRLKR
jgi:hypothetical protein